MLYSALGSRERDGHATSCGQTDGQATAVRMQAKRARRQAESGSSSQMGVVRQHSLGQHSTARHTGRIVQGMNVNFYSYSLSFHLVSLLPSHPQAEGRRSHPSRATVFPPRVIVHTRLAQSPLDRHHCHHQLRLLRLAGKKAVEIHTHTHPIPWPWPIKHQ